MIVTPTYHVFEMYKVHQGATYLPSDLTCNAYRYEGQQVQSLSTSASKDKSGRIHISICNLDPNQPADIDCELQGAQPENVSGRILTAVKMNSHNTFEQPDAVKPAAFNAVDVQGKKILTTLPPMSIVVLSVE